MMDMNTSGAPLGQTAGTSMGSDDVVAGVPPAREFRSHADGLVCFHDRRRVRS